MSKDGKCNLHHLQKPKIEEEREIVKSDKKDDILSKVIENQVDDSPNEEFTPDLIEYYKDGIELLKINDCDEIHLIFTYKELPSTRKKLKSRIIRNHN